MKRILGILVFFPLLVSGQTQTIINGNFENWTTTTFDSYTGWVNSNMESIPKLGKTSCFKSTAAHSGNYAVEVQTVTNGIDTLGGYILNANPGNGNNFTGGAPYSSQPAKITGYYKYSSPGNDSAGIIVIFKKAGTIISQDMFTLGKASGYTSFSYNLSLGSQPDTVIFAATSSYNLINSGQFQTGIIPGSTLYLDDIAFTKASLSVPPLPGGDFETGWVTDNIESPDGWQSSGDPGTIYQTTDSYKGMYAVKLEETSDSGETGITNGKPTHNGSPTGGVPYSGTKDTLIGYYKFVPVGGDIAPVYISFSKNGHSFDGEMTAFSPSGSYKMFSIPYSLSSVPDTMRIDIGTQGNINGPGHAGTTLIIDEIQLKSQPLHTGIELFHPFHAVLSSYPNPVTDFVNIYPVPRMHGKGCINICNSLGQIVISKNLDEFTPGKTIILDTHNLNPGMYMYKVVDGEFNGSGTFIKK